MYEEIGRTLDSEDVLSTGLWEGERSGALPLKPSPCDGGFQRGCFRLAVEPERDTETQTSHIQKSYKGFLALKNFIQHDNK